MLFPTNLVYGPPDGPPKDSVAINSTSVCEPIDVDGKKFAFKLTTKVPTEELILNCESVLERDDWIKAISDVANPPAVDPTKTAEERELEDEMNRLRLQHEKEAAAHEEAEARRLEDERLHKEKLAALEAAAAAKKAEEERLAFVAKPFSCNKKISTENSYQKRFVFVNGARKEFHWGKSEEDCSAGTSKSIHLPALAKSVTGDGASFSVVFKDGAELPEHVWNKSVFSSTAPSSIDIQMESEDACKTFVAAIAGLI